MNSATLNAAPRPAPLSSRPAGGAAAGAATSSNKRRSKSMRSCSNCSSLMEAFASVLTPQGTDDEQLRRCKQQLRDHEKEHHALRSPVSPFNRPCTRACSSVDNGGGSLLTTLRRRLILNNNTPAPSTNRISGPNHTRAVVDVSGGRYRMKSP